MRTFTTLVCLVLAGLAAAVRAQQPVPDLPDLMIRTREVFNHPRVATTTEVIYLKGARQRREAIFDDPARQKLKLPKNRGWIRISQCDEGRYLLLNEEVKTYAYEKITPSAVYARAVQRMATLTPPELSPTSPANANLPLVTTTIDTVDTGERRAYGSYTARHVITTSTTEAGPGAVTRGGVSQQDGWYLDLPGSDCEDMGGSGQPTQSYLIATPENQRERYEIKQRRTARRGYPLEVKVRSTPASSYTSHIELVEISEAPIDDGMFTVPPGYYAAMPSPYGGYDLMKPDTFMNRVQSYERVVEDWVFYLLGDRPRGY